MLVDLTPNQVEIDRMTAICKEHGFDLTFLCSHPDNHIETGVYRCGCDHNFKLKEFSEKFDDSHYSMIRVWYTLSNGERIPLEGDIPYGVADNIEQIKERYKEWLDDPDTKWVITITKVYQDKNYKGKGGGWRWHKWGEYIGTLEPQCEYLDDEDFGDDWQGYVLCYHIYKVL
jgi:hypothetical protein